MHFPGTALPFPDTAQADATAQIANGDTVMQEISKDFTDQAFEKALDEVIRGLERKTAPKKA